ncbi:MAG: hypothetical protein PHN45_00880 [Methylococcales bacterium]|nr:hypothetical protein [Methylococcales bacterium]
MSTTTYTVDETPNTDTHTQENMPTVAARILSSRQIVAILSDLVAMLERIKYEDRPSGKHVFSTTWTRELFDSCLTPKMLKEFNIELWYDTIASQIPIKRVNEFTGIMDPALYNGEIKTNWVVPLFHLERISPGFITMLHGILSLETQAHEKMNQHVKLTCQSETYGMEESNANMEAAAAATSHTHEKIQFIKYK